MGIALKGLVAVHLKNLQTDLCAGEVDFDRHTHTQACGSTWFAACDGWKVALARQGAARLWAAIILATRHTLRRVLEQRAHKLAIARLQLALAV